MKALLRLSGLIDAINASIGKFVSWLVLIAVLVSAGNAIIRKTFDVSSNAWLELQWYLFAAVFMLSSAYTLQRNEHIRIDIVSGRLSKRARDWIDIFGHVFMLLPFVLLMVVESSPYALLSWNTQEMSSNAGGLILWPAKILIPLAFLLLTAQAFSELVKRIAIVAGVIEDTTPQHHGHASGSDEDKTAEASHD